MYASILTIAVAFGFKMISPSLLYSTCGASLMYLVVTSGCSLELLSQNKVEYRPRIQCLLDPLKDQFLFGDC
jgi:hypothetical protein